MFQHNSKASQQTAPRAAGGNALAAFAKLGAPIGRASNGELVSTLVAAINQIVADANGHNRWTKLQVLPLDTSSNLQLSSIHLAATGKDRVVIYTLIIDGTGGARAPREYKGSHGRTYEVPRVAGDLYNDAYWNVITDLLRPQLSLDRIDDAGACVIPAGFDVEVKGPLQVLINCALNAINHVFDTMGNGDHFVFSAADFGDVDWVTKTVFHPGTGVSPTGLPVRRNVEITTQGRVRGGNPDVQRDTLQLSKISAFVNLQYIGISQERNQYGQPIHGERQYLPVINITGTEMEQDAITPEMQLFALLTTYRLSQRGAWMNAFRPRYGADQSEDLHRLDGLGKELNMTINTADPQFDPIVFLQQYAYQDPVFLLHVEQVGPMSWILNAIADAGAGIPEAETAVFDALERLTNNKFGTLYKPTSGVPAFQTMPDVLVNGWYVDRNGVRQDLRDLDTLAIENLVTGADISLAMEFEQTFDASTGTPEERMHRRVEIYNTLTSNQARIEGFSRVVAISGDLLEAAYNAMQMAGMSLRSEGPADIAAAPVRENLGMLRFATRTVDTRTQGGAVAGQWVPAMRTAYHR